jgi:hypothetical protein
MDNEDYGHLGVGLKYLGINRLKGVVNNEDYPIIGIPTERSKTRRDLESLRERLDGTLETRAKDLFSYLKKFVEVHRIEEPLLKVKPSDDNLAPPKFYTETYMEYWQRTISAEQERKRFLEESATESVGEMPDQAEIGDIVNDVEAAVVRQALED